jgi:hypothetical protein
MKRINIILIMLLMCTASCVTIVKWRYGITNPKVQTPQKLRSFLEKHRYPGSCQYLFNDSGSFFHTIRNTLFRKNMFSNMIFDSSGLLIQRDTALCQWSGYQVIKALCPDSNYQTIKGLVLQDILGCIHPADNTHHATNSPGRADFTVVVTWAKFLGTYNARLFDLTDAIDSNKTARIRLIWLNTDMQECWHLTKKQKLQVN